MAHREDETANFELDLSGMLGVGREEDEEHSLDLRESHAMAHPDSPMLRDLRDLVVRHQRRELSEADLAEGVGWMRNRFVSGARRLENLSPGASELEQVLVRGTAAVMHEMIDTLDSLVLAIREQDRVSLRSALMRTEDLVGILEQVYNATRAA